MQKSICIKWEQAKHYRVNDVTQGHREEVVNWVWVEGRVGRPSIVISGPVLEG